MEDSASKTVSYTRIRVVQGNLQRGQSRSFHIYSVHHVCQKLWCCSTPNYNDQGREPDKLDGWQVRLVVMVRRMLGVVKRERKRFDEAHGAEEAVQSMEIPNAWMANRAWGIRATFILHKASSKPSWGEIH